MRSFMRSFSKLSGLLIGSTIATDAAAQAISLSADTLQFSGRTGGPNPPVQLDSITNPGAGTLPWRIVGTTASWLSVSPRTGTTPAALAFAVNITGRRVGAYSDTVIVASNDPVTPRKQIVVLLTIQGSSAPGPPAGSAIAEYQVELLYTGYTGLVDGYPNCTVNTRGTDHLTGRVIGYETSTPGDNIEYLGTLKRVTLLDICETKGRNRPNDVDDEQVWCVATLAGSANMRVSLEVYGEPDRGAWLKAVPDTGTTSSVVTGVCAVPTMIQYRTDYPGGSGGGGGGPDGQAIADAFGATKFVVGGVGRLRVGTYPPDPSQFLAGSPGSGWVLKVIAKIR